MAPRSAAPAVLPKPSRSWRQQFADLHPTDWAYQALSHLVERYGCVADYPEGRFRGRQAMTRYEAAALLNACLDRVTEVTDQRKRLLQEFESELAVLRGRVNGVEAKVGERGPFRTQSEEDFGAGIDCADVVAIDRLYYQFPIGSSLTATLGARVQQDDMLAIWPSLYTNDRIHKTFQYAGAPGAYSQLQGAGAGLWWKQAGRSTG